jgi:hypothetical protein
MYKQKPELFKDRIDEFTDVMLGTGDDWVKSSTNSFYMEIAKDHPEVTLYLVYLSHELELLVHLL